jgi:AcrR family transcriptional regulator
MATTRTRIVDAAAELYRVQGATRTTIARIARAADVAPATVRNHFPALDDLAAAVADRVMTELRMPGPETFDGIAAVPDRVAALARAMAGYYERSQPWYRMDQLDDRPLAAWAEARGRYEADLEALVRTALGPLGGDEEAVALVGAVIDPGLFGVHQRRGRGLDDAAVLVGGLLGPWLTQRLAAGRASAGRRSRRR